MEINIFYSGIKYIIDKITTFFSLTTHEKKKRQKKRRTQWMWILYLWAWVFIFFPASKAFKYKANIKITRRKKNSQL